MDIATVAGLLTACIMMGGSLLVMGLEGKGAVNYGVFIDPPAIMMVVGGAFGVGLVGFPLRNVLGLPKVIMKVFFNQPENLDSLDRSIGRAGQRRPVATGCWRWKTRSRRSTIRSSPWAFR